MRTFSELPLFPLPQLVLMPGVHQPFYVFEPRYRAMLAHVLDRDGLIGFPMLLQGPADEEGRPPIRSLFGVAQVEDYVTHDDGTSHIVVQGKGRVALVEELPLDVFRRARARLLEEVQGTPDQEEAAAARLRALGVQLRDLLLPEDAREGLSRILEGDATSLLVLTSLLATILVQRHETRQELLEIDPVVARAERLAEHLQALLDTLA